MNTFLRSLVVEEEGADATEYALVIGLIALVIIAGVTALGTGLNSAFNTIAGHFSGGTIH